jgi:hypothetical protein
MNTVDHSWKLVANDNPVAFLNQAESKPRMSRSASRRLPTTASSPFRAPSATTEFLDHDRLGEGAPVAVAWRVPQDDNLSDGLVGMPQWSPALDNEHDPTDQDSRAWFPDKAFAAAGMRRPSCTR